MKYPHFAEDAVLNSPVSPSSTRAIARNGRREAAATLLVTAIWFGLLTAYVELGILGFRKLVLHEMLGRSLHFVWMAPLFYVLLFGAVSAPFVLASLRWPTLAIRSGVFSFASLSALSTLILLAYNRLHSIAILLLAVGVGLHAVRWVLKKEKQFARFARMSVVMLAGAVVLGVSFSATRVTRERAALSRLGTAPAGAPNVVFIILDTVRAASLSLYGYAKATTPSLERFAANGIVFDNAIAPSPWTLPSHASLFTGRPASELSADWLVPLDDRERTLAEAFRSAGYDTGAFVANLLYTTWESGLQDGFRHYSDYPVSAGQVVMNASFGRFLAGRWKLRELIGNDEVLGRKTAAQVNSELLQWLGDKRDRPFFAFLNYYDAHDPYLPPNEYYRAMSGQNRPNRLSPLRRVPIPERRKGVSAENVRIEVNSYDGAIAYLDHHLGVLFAELENRGLMQNTLVVITADHGEEFGEHGLWYHGNSLYLPALHVPLVIALPARVPQGTRVAAPVSLTDVAATVQNLALPAAAPFPGRNLLAARDTLRPPVVSSVRKGVRLPEWYPIAASGMTSVIEREQHYICDETGREELFNIAADPWEQRDLLRDRVASPWLAEARKYCNRREVRH